MALVWVISTRDPYWSANEWLDAAGSAIAVFERTGDELGLARAYDVLGWAENARNRFGAQAVARELAYEHAKLAGDPVMDGWSSWESGPAG